MDKQNRDKISNMVRQGYDQIAPQFSETREKHLPEGLISIANEVREDESVLDAGCGSGRLLRQLPEKSDYLGVDISQGLLSQAGKSFPGRQFRQGNVLDLGKINRIGFDHVFCIAVLQHIPGRRDRTEALRQMRNKVAEDGRIIVSVWNMWAEKKFRRMAWKNLALKLLGKNKMDFGDVVFDWKNEKGEVVAKRYYHMFLPGEMRKAVRKARLSIVDIRRDKHNTYYILSKKR